jgi:hypothetical protein
VYSDYLWWMASQCSSELANWQTGSLSSNSSMSYVQSVSTYVTFWAIHKEYSCFKEMMMDPCLLSLPIRIVLWSIFSTSTNKRATQHRLLILMNYSVLYHKKTIGRNCDAHFSYEFFILCADGIKNSKSNSLICLKSIISSTNKHRLTNNYAKYRHTFAPQPR